MLPNVNARIHPSSQFKATSRTVKIAHRISTMQWLPPDPEFANRLAARLDQFR
jgi:hypothetical protein